MNLDDSVTKYIGKWTQLEDAKENPITIKNLLTMTSGLDVDFNFQFKPGSNGNITVERMSVNICS